MKTLNSFSALQSTVNNSVVVNSLYQKPVQRLSQYQQELFKIATQGITALTPEQEHRLDKVKRREIELVASRTNRVLSMWKQAIITNSLSTLFSRLFPKAPATNGTALLMMPIQDGSFEPEVSLRDLGITKVQIIEKLIATGCLPENFYELKAA